MKLLIEIPKEKYEWIKAHNLNIDNDSIVGAVANGTPYEERPKGEWVPVSERLPNRNGVYNVTRKLNEGETIYFISDASYFDGQNTWHRDTGINHGRPYLTDIIAWQPLPEPYKTDMRGEENEQHRG